MSSTLNTLYTQLAALFGPVDDDWRGLVERIISDLATGINGHNVAAYADGGLTPGSLVVYTRALAAGASADYDHVLAGPAGATYEVLEVTAQKRAANGGATDSVTLKKGSAIVTTTALDLNIADRTMARATLIDDANSTFAVGDTIRLTTVQGTNAACLVTVIFVRRS